MTMSPVVVATVAVDGVSLLVLLSVCKHMLFTKIKVKATGVLQRFMLNKMCANGPRDWLVVRQRQWIQSPYNYIRSNCSYCKDFYSLWHTAFKATVILSLYYCATFMKLKVSVSALPWYLTFVIIVILVLILTILYSVLNCECLNKIKTKSL